MLAALIVAAVLVVTKVESAASTGNWLDDAQDFSSDPHIFATNTLPADDRFMPSVGNGHIATNVFSDVVHVNGIYNGLGGESRRARIPGYANVRLKSTLKHHPFKPIYSLDTKEAVFKVTVDTDRAVITQRIFAHRFYTRAIVNQIQVAAKPVAEPYYLHDKRIAVKLMQGPNSDDINFEAPVSDVFNGRTIWTACGQTKEVEDPRYQPLPTDVCVSWTSVPEYLAVPKHGSKVFTFAMTVDKNRTVAKNEILQVLKEDGEQLFRKHVDHWEQLYHQRGIDIEGDLKLSKLVNGVWYFLLSSLPSDESYHPLDQFYGLSPGGLARGTDDYRGHTFWDTEVWMYPPILMLYPNQARALLQYRLNNAHVAADHAKEMGNKGYRYPWESAFTGAEVTPDCCPEVTIYEQHITGCISFAIRQFLATNRDEDWLKNGGCSMVTNIADFWASRVKMNYKTGLYDIENVMGPDEDHFNVSNSVFTNVIAGYSLYLAQYVSCLCKDHQETKNPDHWADIAWRLALPYDSELDYHPQFLGYERGDIIKQADAVLLGFPLQYEMDVDTRNNDLLYYESVTRSNGPAMTWSMHAIGHLDMNDYDKATELFKKSYSGYAREPFKVWSEVIPPDVGAVNFQTGMGGLLQTLIFGYGGVRVHLDRLELTRPLLPPDTTKLTIKGIKYLGASLSLNIMAESTSLTIHSVDDDWPLTLYNDRYNIILGADMTVPLIGKGPFTIRSSPWKECKLPSDTIGHSYLRPKDT